jgi:hypothetical protein
MASPIVKTVSFDIEAFPQVESLTSLSVFVRKSDGQSYTSFTFLGDYIPKG